MYCQKFVGDSEFSIDEWNKAHKMCEELNLSETDRNKTLHPEPVMCKEQCFDCMVIVAERRRKTNEIINRIK